mmetsp:Transcript_14315/g.27791  ORF Transcript_14315/g.27791 Transcript_14315/m.27791 type:complete len:437 (-) Transcript_14315:1146-2456(-)
MLISELLFALNDKLVSVVELAEGTTDIVDVLAEVVRLKLVDSLIEAVAEAKDGKSKIPFLRAHALDVEATKTALDDLLSLSANNLLHSTLNAANTGVHVHEVDSSVTIALKHVIIVEDIVLDASVLQVKVFDSGVTQLGGCLRNLLRSKQALVLLDTLVQVVRHTVAGLVKEIHETNGATLTSTEALAVSTLHNTKGDVVKADTINPASTLSSLKASKEVTLLAGISDVGNPVKVKLFGTVADGSHIGSIIAVTTVTLHNKERHRVGLSANDLSAIIILEKLASIKFLDSVRDAGVIKRLTTHTIREGNVQTIVDLREHALTDVQEQLPASHSLRVATLELDDLETGLLLELLRRIKGLFGRLVKCIKIRNCGSAFQVVGVVVAHVGKEHTELGAPITNVVDALDIMTLEGEHTAKNLTNDCRAQVANMHLLGNVW